MELARTPMPMPTWSAFMGRFEGTVPEGLSIVSWQVGPAQVIEGAPDQPHIVAMFPPGQHWVTLTAKTSAGEDWSICLPVTGSRHVGQGEVNA